MAKQARFETGTKLDLLDSYNTVMGQSQKEPTKLFVVLCNEEFPDRGTIEGRFKNWKSQYETKPDIKFYKCVIEKGEQAIKKELKVEDTPTFIFIRNGVIIDRIDDLDESDPSKPSEAMSPSETNDEKRVKAKLKELTKPT